MKIVNARRRRPRQRWWHRHRQAIPTQTHKTWLMKHTNSVSFLFFGCSSERVFAISWIYRSFFSLSFFCSFIRWFVLCFVSFGCSLSRNSLTVSRIFLARARTGTHTLNIPFDKSIKWNVWSDATSAAWAVITVSS